MHSISEDFYRIELLVLHELITAEGEDILEEIKNCTEKKFTWQNR